MHIFDLERYNCNLSFYQNEDGETIATLADEDRLLPVATENGIFFVPPGERRIPFISFGKDISWSGFDSPADRYVIGVKIKWSKESKPYYDKKGFLEAFAQALFCFVNLGDVESYLQRCSGVIKFNNPTLWGYLKDISLPAWKAVAITFLWPFPAEDTIFFLKSLPEKVIDFMSVLKDLDKPDDILLSILSGELSWGDVQ